MRLGLRASLDNVTVLTSKPNAGPSLPTLFTDDFAGTDGSSDLGDRTGWELAGGSSGGGIVSSGVFRSNTSSSTGSIYISQELAANGDPYVQAKLLNTSGRQWLCGCVSDVNNFVGVRFNVSILEVYKRVAGTFVFIASVSAAHSSTKNVRMALTNGTVRVWYDGALIIDTTWTVNIPYTRRTGLIARLAVQNFADDYEAGLL